MAGSGHEYLCNVAQCMLAPICDIVNYKMAGSGHEYVHKVAQCMLAPICDIVKVLE